MRLLCVKVGSAINANILLRKKRFSRMLCRDRGAVVNLSGRGAQVHILLSLLDANLKLHQHAARALEKAAERRHGAFDEQAFMQAYLALRDVEVRELALLHQTALLAQALKRDEVARRTERELAQTFQAQETGNGKKAVILTPEAVQQQTRTVAKDHRTVSRHAEEWVNIFLAQHEALVRADALFRACDRALILLDAHENDAVLKTYALAGDNAQRLREMAMEEIERARPRALAAALEAHRSKMRQHLTRLSNARRHFAAFIYQHMPLIGAP